MKYKITKLSFFEVAYIILTLLVLYSIYTKTLMFELVVKVLALLIIAFFYLNSKINRVNWYYIFALSSSLISDSLYVFEDKFMSEATVFLLLNRVFFLLIVKDVLYRYPIKNLLLYSIPFFITFTLIFYQLYGFLDNFLYISMFYGVVTVVLGVFSFLNYLHKSTIENFNFLLGVLLFVASDSLMVITNFLDERTVYIMVYHAIYYIAMFIMCKSVILQKKRTKIV